MANRIPARLTAKEGRQFGRTVGGAFLILAAIAWWRGRHLPEYAFGGIGAILLLGGALIPEQLTPIYRAWMGLAHALSKITTPLFMAIVYFIVLMPVGILMRLFGRNPIRHEAVKDSYWMERTDARGTMTNQF